MTPVPSAHITAPMLADRPPKNPLLSPGAKRESLLWVSFTSQLELTQYFLIAPGDH